MKLHEAVRSAAVARKAGLPHRGGGALVLKIAQAITDLLIEGKAVRLNGLGTFYVAPRKGYVLPARFGGGRLPDSLVLRLKAADRVTAALNSGGRAVAREVGK
jgi:hypothetical protein